MSTYQELKGLKVKYLSSDTSGDRIKEGEVFYNSTDFNLKSFIQSAAWHSGADLGTGRYAMAQGTGGTVDAAIAIFGRATTNLTEEYNGTGWANGGNGGTARYGGAKFGTQTSAVAVGGKASANVLQNVEEYDGSSWTEVTNYPSTARGYLSGFGILTAGVVCGGSTASPDTWYDLTEEYDGTNWATGGTLNTARSSGHGTTGLLTAGLTFGGTVPALTAKTEEYNGTSWTESGDMNTARSNLAGSGTQASALAYGGLTPPTTTATEAYDGSTWTTSSATLAVGAARHSSAGSAANTGLAFGGNPPGIKTTQEFTVSLSETTAGAWASGGNLNTAGTGMAGAGTQTAGLCAGRKQPPASPNYVGLTEEYDGSSWTESGDLNTGRNHLGGCGTQTAAIAAGGFTGPAPSGGSDHVHSEEYNGSSWTEGGNMNQSRRQYSMFGIQTAAVGAGGYSGPSSPGPANGFVAKTEEYDGSSWTTVEDLPTALNNHGAAGTLTAGVLFGGEGGSPHPEGGGNVVSLTWEYDGTNHASGGALNTGRGSLINAGGTQTAAWGAGGGTPPGAATNVEHYDGSSWVTAPSIATGRTFGNGAKAALQPAGMIFGGGNSNATEEFTGETTAARAVKTIDFD